MINRIKSYFKDISRNVRVMAVGSFLNDASTEMIYPLLPRFLTHTLGASVGFVGIIEGIAESTAALAKLISGWYSDRIGSRKGLTVLGYSVSGLTRPIIALAMFPWHILTARFIDRIGKGVRTAPRDALLVASVDPKTRGKAFGFHRAFDNSGAIVGPALAMLILWFFPGNYRLLFWLAAIPTALAVLVLWLGIIEIKAPNHTPRVAGGRPNLSWKSLDKNFHAYLLVMFIFTLGNSSDAFLLLRAENLGVKDYHLPLLWIVLHIVKSTSNIPGGSLADKWGRRKTIILGWAIYALIYAGFAIANVNWHVWALFAAYGLYFGLTEGAERALVSDMADESVRGTAYGFFHLAVGLAAFPASALFGFLWDRLGIEVAFAVGAVLALIASILLAAIVKPVKR